MKQLNPAAYLIAAAALLLTVATAIRILVGPVDLSVLKEWQPTLASTIAFTAAVLAYAAATGRISLDRALARKAAIEKRVGVFLRLQQAMMLLSFQMEQIAEKAPLKTSDRIEMVGKTFTEKDLAYHKPEELNEAWLLLELLPYEAVRHIATLRLAFSLEPFNFASARVRNFGEIDAEFADFLKGCELIKEESDSLKAILEKEIRSLRDLEPRI